MKNKIKSFPAILIITLAVVVLISNTGIVSTIINSIASSTKQIKELTNIYENINRKQKNNDSTIPEYIGNAYVVINDNLPMFDSDDLAKVYENNEYVSFIELSELDEYKRAGAAMMVAGPETITNEQRESIGMIKPSGWKQARYDDLIEDKYLYNRCHLLAHSISRLNAEEKNLITGTRQMNAGAMLDFEIKVIEYIENTNNHVLYRVTPVYEGNNLLASGVLMEALSLEEEGLEFCVFIYNVQDGIEIDYATGESRRK